MDTNPELTSAIRHLAAATEANTQLLRLLIKAMPASQEARLLGVSTRTVQRRRKAAK